MALGICKVAVDSRGKELIEHGSVAFPVACYHDDLSKDPVPWHWHEELEAAVITEGTCIVAAGKEKYTIRAGEGFFINSQILHGCWDMDASACRFHSLCFHPRLVGGSLDSVFYQDYVIPLVREHGLESRHLKPETPWQARALEAIEEAWQAVYREEAGYEFQVRQALSQLVFLLSAHIPDQAKQPGQKQLRSGARIKIMLQFLQDHCAEELTVEAIAASAAISESECLRCFRAAIGTTPIQYLRQYRIQKAARLLADTQLHIAEIGSRCGFSDMSYFTKCFRQIKGCTPSQYRKIRK